MFLCMLKSALIIAFQCGTDSAPVNDFYYWEKDGPSVIYAEVLDVGRNADTGDWIRFRPIATLSGSLDAAYENDICANAWIGGSYGISLIRNAPMRGANVVALVRHVVFPGRQFYQIPNANVIIFPQTGVGFPGGEKHRPPLFEVTGFDDPKVTETIETLRKLRGKQREEAEKAKAEQKAAAEKKSPPGKQSTK